MPLVSHRSHGNPLLCPDPGYPVPGYPDPSPPRTGCKVGGWPSTESPSCLTLCCTIFFQLGSLPESFSNLGGLDTLDLFSNRLTELPDVINHLGNLKRLDLDENQFELKREDVPRIHRKLTYPEKPKMTSGGKDWRTRGRQNMIQDVKIEKVNFTRKSRKSECQKNKMTKRDIAS